MVKRMRFWQAQWTALFGVIEDTPLMRHQIDTTRLRSGMRLDANPSRHKEGFRPCLQDILANGNGRSHGKAKGGIHTLL
jgi:hypothetical protein